MRDRQRQRDREIERQKFTEMSALLMPEASQWLEEYIFMKF